MQLEGEPALYWDVDLRLDAPQDALQGRARFGRFGPRSQTVQVHNTAASWAVGDGDCWRRRRQGTQRANSIADHGIPEVNLGCEHGVALVLNHENS